jgi:cell division protein FtsQ
MKKILKIGGLVLLLAYFPVILAFVSFDKHKTLCRDIASEINDSVANRFITSQEVRDIVLEKYPDIMGTMLDDINTDEMEHFFEKYSAIENCEVYYSVSGVLHVDITQKKPLLRVFDNKGSYYLDKKGNKMPLSTNYTAHVLVANGHIDRLKNTKSLFELAVFINNDPFWRSQIEQIYVDRKGEFNLIPRVGDHIVEFGGLDRMETKFRNLKALYVNGWKAREWNLYKKVSLKYNGQVVCSKGN